MRTTTKVIVLLTTKPSISNEIFSTILNWISATKNIHPIHKM